MSEDHEHRSESIFSKIAIPVLIAVLIALIAGGTAPWWWDRVFPPESASPSEQPSETASPTPQPSATVQPTATDQPSETEAPSFLGSLQGEWTFVTWQERSGPVVLFRKPLTGFLVFDAIGHAYWDMEIDDGSGAPQPTSGLRCLGVVDAAAETLSRWTGGPLTVNGEDVMAEARNWTSNMNSLRGDTLLAFCGSAFPEVELFVYDTTQSDYTLTMTTAADGSRLLAMRNAAGTFTWRKTS
ncbi:MAG TPA: hypothetical protein VFJ00_03375 [Candidatus Limnocylindria bacterium]|nr:hypothetical protein [Candidatus Limnocylindria bacterium]